MFGLDPRLIGLFGIVFVALGIFSIFQGRRRLRAVRAQGQRMVWYKQVNILTGIEYLLLAVVLLLSLGINYRWFSQELRNVLIPIYWTFLLISAVILCMVMYQGMTAMRRKQPAAAKEPRQPLAVYESEEVTPHQRAEQARKRRQRRHKAAEARKRRAGAHKH